jgi:hypothetical protein
LYNLMVVSTVCQAADYLVVLAEEGDDDAFAEDKDEEGQAADAGVKGPESAASTEDGGAPVAGDGRPTSPDSWQAEFKRLEEAWLAGRTVIAASDIIT